MADWGSEGDQRVVPPSFVALFQQPGGHKLREPRAVVAERHELCEDMAQMLTETALTKRFELGVNDEVVLQRIEQGLRAEGGVLGPDEAHWVVCRLAELLDWPMPG